MVTLTGIDVEVGSFYATVSWVARHYGVTRTEVHRAIKSGRLRAVRLKGNIFVLDTRQLPARFPRPLAKW
jgi:hypothetical protein